MPIYPGFTLQNAKAMSWLNASRGNQPINEKFPFSFNVTEYIQFLGQTASLIDLKITFVMLLYWSCSWTGAKKKQFSAWNVISYIWSFGATAVWLRIKIKRQTPSEILCICILKSESYTHTGKTIIILSFGQNPAFIWASGQAQLCYPNSYLINSTSSLHADNLKVIYISAFPECPSETRSLCYIWNNNELLAVYTMEAEIMVNIWGRNNCGQRI